MFIEIVSSVDFWKFVVPLLGAVIAWLVNEWRKRIWEQYQRKEDQYKILIKCLQGFYVGNINPEISHQLKAEFLQQLNVCWLYCPDDVIKKSYAFLDTVHSSQIQSDEVKEKAMNEFVLAVRKDLLSRRLVYKTKLIHEDFRHLKAN